MSRLIRRAELLVGVALGLAAAGSGCGAQAAKATVPSGRDAPWAGAVRTLWAKHGGAEAWRRHTAVTFAYSVEERNGRRTVFPEVAFRLDDYRNLWVRKDAGAEPRLILPDASSEFEGSPALGFALASIRYFFSLPLASSVGRWEFRQLLAPPDVSLPPVLEVLPREPSSPIGPCRLSFDEKSGLVRRVVFTGRHPFVSGGSQTVELDLYEEISGMQIARLRTGTRLREEVSDIVFLSRGEADSRYPLPEPEATVPASCDPAEAGPSPAAAKNEARGSR